MLCTYTIICILEGILRNLGVCCKAKPDCVGGTLIVKDFKWKLKGKNVKDQLKLILKSTMILIHDLTSNFLDDSLSYCGIRFHLNLFNFIFSRFKCVVYMSNFNWQEHKNSNYRTIGVLLEPCMFENMNAHNQFSLSYYFSSINHQCTMTNKDKVTNYYWHGCNFGSHFHTCYCNMTKSDHEIRQII